MASPRRLICPWCGALGPPADACAACGGRHDEASRRTVQNDMGPWFVRDPDRPFQPGVSWESIARRVESGDIGPTTILRGPTTRQLWAAARRTPAVAHLLGYCHACDERVPRGASSCLACSTRFQPWLERDRLGLAPIRLDGEVPAPEPGTRLARTDAPARPARPTAIVRSRPSAAPLVRRTAVRPGHVTSAAALEAAQASARARQGGGSGAWTVMIGGLVLALVGLALLPAALAQYRRLVAGPDGDAVVTRTAQREADVPRGTFRLPTESRGVTETGLAGDPEAVGESAPSTREGPGIGDGESVPSAETPTSPAPPNAARAARAARVTPGTAGDEPDSDPSWELRRLRRVGEDPNRSAADRLEAWADLASLAESLPRSERRGLDRTITDRGRSRVHLEAFLGGGDPAVVAGIERTVEARRSRRDD